VWKAIYFHYLPIGVEADAAPSKAQLGATAITWAAVALADKLDSVVGMFAAGERPTGSRDPLGLRRQAQGIVKILADLPALTGIEAKLTLGPLLERAALAFGGLGDSRPALAAFMADRLAYLLEQRGFDVRSVRAVMHVGAEQVSPLEARLKLEALGQLGRSEALLAVAALLKRVKNITKGIAAPEGEERVRLRERLSEAAELALAADLDARAPGVSAAAAQGAYREAFTAIGALQPTVSRFFDDVLVMAEDAGVRAARLGLVAELRDLILSIADISEIVADS
jgi:glycyl-tRNA synthetase beta chain